MNIDIKGIFNKLYCVVCGGSTSPRAFLQMTARIRHLNNNTINILNNSLKINDCRNFWTFEETKNEDDFDFAYDEVKIVVDAMSLQYLTGASIDYKEDLQGSSFTIKNPQAVSTCGCGSSFSI